MTLKEQLREHFIEQESEYDPEETQTVLEILDECEDDLSDVYGISKTLLLRLINDSDLYDKVDSIGRDYDIEKNLFD